MGANFLALLLSTTVLQSPQPDTVPPQVRLDENLAEEEVAGELSCTPCAFV